MLFSLEKNITDTRVSWNLVIYQSAVDSPHKEPVMFSFGLFSLVLARANCKTNDGDVSHHDDHVMSL